MILNTNHDRVDMGYEELGIYCWIVRWRKFWNKRIIRDEEIFRCENTGLQLAFLPIVHRSRRISCIELLSADSLTHAWVDRDLQCSANIAFEVSYPHSLSHSLSARHYNNIMPLTLSRSHCISLHNCWTIIGFVLSLLQNKSIFLREQSVSFILSWLVGQVIQYYLSDLAFWLAKLPIIWQSNLTLDGYY